MPDIYAAITETRKVSFWLNNPQQSYQVTLKLKNVCDM